MDSEKGSFPREKTSSCERFVEFFPNLRVQPEDMQVIVRCRLSPLFSTQERYFKKGSIDELLQDKTSTQEDLENENTNPNTNVQNKDWRRFSQLVERPRFYQKFEMNNYTVEEYTEEQKIASLDHNETEKEFLLEVLLAHAWIISEQPLLMRK